MEKFSAAVEAPKGDIRYFPNRWIIQIDLTDVEFEAQDLFSLQALNSYVS
jgi:hypothetical protein